MIVRVSTTLNYTGVNDAVCVEKLQTCGGGTEKSSNDFSSVQNEVQDGYA